jgi:tetratricopeptide (TPR) repeat protein
MVGSFACPECGSAVGTRRSTPGRQVHCSECGTLVEIPFLPRAAGGRRGGRRSPRGWAWAALGLVAAILMVVGAVEIARNRGHAAREREIAAVVARAEAAEASGRFDEALAASEQAIKLAKALDPSTLKPLKERRDRLAVRDAEARLAAVEAMPDPIEGLRALRAVVEADPAREPVRDRVIGVLSAALSARAESDLGQAAQTLAAGQPAVAMNLCERVARTADELGHERAGGLRDAARAIAEKIIGRYGVVFAPVTGEFVDGPRSARLHATALHPFLAAALRRKGFLPRPEKSPFLAVWDQSAPYRLTLEVIERNDVQFFQTPLQGTRLNVHFALMKGTTVLWQTRIQAKTRIPPPDMNAFEMSHLSLTKTRDPAIEKRLYDDARIVLGENLATSLGKLPEP